MVDRHGGISQNAGVAVASRAHKTADSHSRGLHGQRSMSHGGLEGRLFPRRRSGIEVVPHADPVEAQFFDLPPGSAKLLHLEPLRSKVYTELHRFPPVW